MLVKGIEFYKRRLICCLIIQ